MPCPSARWRFCGSASSGFTDPCILSVEFTSESPSQMARSHPWRWIGSPTTSRATSRPVVPTRPGPGRDLGRSRSVEGFWLSHRVAQPGRGGSHLELGGRASVDLAGDLFGSLGGERPGPPGTHDPERRPSKTCKTWNCGHRCIASSKSP